jgi:hypothetical protein
MTPLTTQSSSESASRTAISLRAARTAPSVCGHAEEGGCMYMLYTTLAVDGGLVLDIK